MSAVPPSPSVVREVRASGWSTYRLRVLAALLVLIVGTMGVVVGVVLLLYHSRTILEVFVCMFFGYLGVLVLAVLLLRRRPT